MASNVPNQLPVEVVDVVSTVAVASTKEIAHPAVSAPISTQVSENEGDAFFKQTLYQRYLLVDSFQWNNATQSQQYDFPACLERIQDPMLAMLKSFCFWNCDVEVIAKVSATKFQIGQLYFFYLYDGSSAEELKYRYADGSIINVPGAFLNASASNEVKLTIPYQSVRPYTRTDASLFKFGFSNWCRLTAPNNEFQSCTVSVFVRISRADFMGVRSMPQMMTIMRAIVRGSEAALKSVRADVNRDNPTDPSNPIVVVNRNTQSWCAGDLYVENLNVLRLNPSSLTGHRSAMDEMRISYLAKRFGYYAEFNINKNLVSGANVWSTLVSPMNLGTRTKVQDKKIHTCTVPAVTALASQFAYWRGDLEYRFDIIASGFHNGQFAVTFTPMATNAVSYRVGRSSYSTVVPLDGITSFTFRVPYKFPYPWATTADMLRGQMGQTIGSLDFHVINQLVAPSTTMDYVTVYVYLRACDNFELSIPSSPYLTLPFEPAVAIAQSFSLMDTSLRYCTAISRKEADGNTYYYLQFYSENSSNLVENVQLKYPEGENYDLKDSIVTPMLITMSFYKSKPTVKNVGTARFRYAKWTKNQAGTDYTSWRARLSINLTDFDKGKPLYESDKVQATAVNTPAYFDIEVATPEGGEDVADMKMEPSRGNMFVDVHGESFDDLKSLCRRYVFYTEFLGTIPKAWAVDRSIMAIPLFVDGLVLNTTADSPAFRSSKVIRHSVIATVASAFRYFRGGLRFKIQVHASDSNGKAVDMHLCFTHVPDYHIKERQVQSLKNIKRSYFPTGHAYYVQSTRSNPFIEIEIPYYKQCEYGLLGRCDEKDVALASLGTLVVSSKSRVLQDINLLMSVSYSIADDMRFYYYHGFMTMGVNPVVVQRPVASDFPALETTSYALRSRGEGTSEEVLRPQGLTDFVSAIAHPLQTARTVLADAGATMAEGAAEHVRENISDARDAACLTASFASTAFVSAADQASKVVIDNIRQALAELKSKCSWMSEFDIPQFLISFSGQISQVFYNPCVFSIAVAIATLIAQMVISFGAKISFSDCFQKLLTAYRGIVSIFMPSSAQRNLSSSDTEIVQPQALSEVEQSAAAATLVAALAACVGITYDVKSYGKGSIIKHLRKDLQTFSATANSLVIFFTNNLSLLQRIFGWFQQSILPCFGIYQDFAECHDFVQDWCRDADMLTSPMNLPSIRADVRMQYQLYQRMVVGEQMVIKCGRAPRKDPSFDLIGKRVTALRKVLDTVVADFQVPGASIEPFVIHIVGEPKIGKSFVVTHVANYLMKRIGYRSFQQLVYTKTPGNPFWNGVNAQPVVHIDDFGFSQINLVEQAATLFQLKTPAPFNPNQAALEDKKRFYAPKVAILTGNRAFPVVPDIAVPDALYRRRDALVGLRLRSGLNDISEASSEALRTFDHLVAMPYTNPTDASSSAGGEGFWKHESRPTLSFSEWLEQTGDAFVAYYEKELVSVKTRLAQMTELFPTESLTITDAAEAFDEHFQKEMVARQKQFLQSDAAFATGLVNPVNDVLGDRELDTYFRGLMDSRPSTIVQAQAGEEDEEDIDDDVDQNIPTFTVDSFEDCQSVDITAPLKYSKIVIPKKNVRAIGMPATSYQVPRTCPIIATSIDVDGKVIDITVPNSLENERPYKHVTSGNYVIKGCCHPTTFVGDWTWSQLEQKFVFGYDYDKLALRVPERRCFGSCNWDDFAVRVAFYREFVAANNVIYLPFSGDAVISDRIPKFLLYNDWIIQEYRDKVTDPYILGRLHPLHVQACNGLIVNQQQFVGLSPLNLEWYLEQLSEIPWARIRQICLTVCKWLAGIGTILGACFLAGRVLGSSSSDQMGPSTISSVQDSLATTEGQFPLLQSVSYDHVSKPVSSSRQFKAFRDQAVKHRASYVRPQGLDASEVAIPLLRRNFARIRVPRPEGRALIVHGLGIAGNSLLTVGHAFQELLANKTEPILSVSIGNSDFISFPFQESSLHQFNDSEMCLYELPRQFSAFRDIRKHIATAAEQTAIQSNPTVGRIVYGNKGEPVFVGCSVQLRCQPGINLATVDGNSTYRLNRLFWTYEGYSGDGFCGSVLFDVSPEFRIYGIHIAGLGTRGYAEPIIRGSFDGVRQRPQAEIDYDASGTVSLRGVNGLGTLRPGTVPHLSNQTRIRPSIAYNALFETSKVPAPLSKFNPYGEKLAEHPLYTGVAKHGGSPFPFQEDIVALAQEDLLTQLITHAKPVLPGSAELLTDDQIFSGVPGVDGYRHLELNTSEGYPLTLQRPKGANNKKWCFEYEDTVQGRKLLGFHPVFKQLLETHSDMRSEGVIPPTIFQDCLKDARISIEKINRPGSTRVFSISPLEFTWTTKRYFGHFQAAYQRARPFSGCAIGINPNGPEWNALVHYLGESSLDFLVTGDYSSFGDRLQSQCLVAAFDIMIAWYEHFFDSPEELSEIRRVIRDELVHVPHIAAQFVYQMFCGLPSGFALTVELNSLVNCLYMRICWLYCMPPELQDLSQFNKHCRLVTYGDDLIMSVSYIVKDLFNFASIKKILETHEIKFTSATKDVNDERLYMPLEECTFLKRSFRKHAEVPTRWMAPLEFASVVDSINWIHSKGNDKEMTLANSKAVIESAYSLGEEEYEKIRRKIVLWWADEHSEKLEVPTWRFVDGRVWGTQGLRFTASEWLFSRTDASSLTFDF